MTAILNQIAEKWFSWQLSMFWQVGLLIAIVAGLDFLIKKWVWPQVRYALWLLILVKLVLPPTLTSPMSFTAEIPFVFKQTLTNADYNTDRHGQTKTIIKPVEPITVPAAKTIATTTAQPVEIVLSTPTATPTPAASPLSLKTYVFFIWSAGVVILSGWLIIRLSNLRHQHLKDKQLNLPERLEDLLASTARKLGLKKVPQIILTNKVCCPAVFGIFRPVLLIPADKLQNLTTQDTENIFLHELAHIKRGDLFVHAVYMILQIAYWFNPLLWLTRKHLQNLRELCCDATVARLLKEKTIGYRQTLLETARQLLAEPVDPGMGLLGLFENSSWLVDRLRWLEKKSWKYRPLRIATVFVLISLMAACVLPMTKFEALPDFVIKGTVTDAQTGKPIVGAKVGDVERYAEGKQYTTTEANGNYSYKTYYEEHGVKAEADGYKRQNKGFGTKLFGKEKEKVIDFQLKPDLHASAGQDEGKNEKSGTSKMNSKIDKFDIDHATRSDVIKVFGEPTKYIWGEQVFDKNNLQDQYIMSYPGNFYVWMVKDQIIEFRFEGPSDYVFGDGLVVGSTIEKALNILGQPSEIVEDKPNEFIDNVLYKNINGRKGHGYYARPEKNIRIWIANDRVCAIYLTRSNFSAGPDKKLKRAELLETSTINEQGHIVDKIDYPFVDDPEVIGGWTSVDFAREIGDFKPGAKNWQGDLFLKELFLLEGGKTNWAFTWTKGLILHSGDKTASKYLIKEIDGSKYMFMEWKSGDYVIGHRKPAYYVLKQNKDAVYVESRTIDKIDYPFVNDPRVLGKWESVDFVDEIEQFKAGYEQWKGGDLFLKEMIFEKNGRLTLKNDKVPKGYSQSWTKGLVISEENKTASKYTIKQINEDDYLFYEWKSGDYTIRGMKPKYYVLKKELTGQGEEGKINGNKGTKSTPAPIVRMCEPQPDPNREDMQVLTGQKGEPGTLSGKVVDEKGNPLKGVMVDADPRHKGFVPRHTGYDTYTDANGYFYISGFKAEQKTIEIEFSKEGFTPKYIIKQPLGIKDAVVVLGNKTYFEGIVSGPDGKVVANATIKAVTGPTTLDGYVHGEVPTECKSDKNGYYRLYVQADVYDIQVKAEQGAVRLQNVRINKDEAKKLDLKLSEAVTFLAKVIDSQTKEPVSGLRLFHWSHPGIEGVSDSNGLVRIPNMLPGRFEFFAESKESGRWWSEDCLSEWSRYKAEDEKTGWQRNFDFLDFDLKTEMQPVTIIVEKGVKIRGKVVDPAGKPVVGATAALARTGSGNSITGDTRYSVTTDANGNFEMMAPASKKAKYNLVAHDGKYEQWRNWANGVLEPIQTNPGDVIDNVIIKLTEPATVKGTVVDSSGKAVPNRQVIACSFDKLENRYYDPTVRTDANGNFEIKFIRPGKHYIQAYPFWLRAEEAPEGTSQIVTLDAGQMLEGIKLVVERERK